MTTVEQDTKASNGLSQTFSNTYSSGPTEGNLLIAFLFHDETLTDVSDLTSSGWSRLGTAVETLGGIDYRISVYGKFAGASESTTVSWDLGEVNRRAHAYAVEFSGSPLVAIPAEDAAASETNGEDPATTSNQLAASIRVGGGQFGLAMVGVTNSSSTPPSWASEVTQIDNWNSNFKATAIGYVDPTAEVQPTATWNTSRTNMQTVFVLGEPTLPLKIKARSSFQIIKS